MYALVDCNNFYVSCERVFNPGLVGKPVIVLSNNDGCAISRSQEAKDLGVEMGAVPHLMKEELRKQLYLFSSNYTLYGDMSDRVMKTLAMFVPRMEVYSIDEAFLDMSDMAYANLQALGVKIRTTVLRNTAIPTCVGIAPTKVLAKMANRYAKKRMKEIGVFAVSTPKRMQQLLEYTEIGEVWGIGRQYADMLIKNKITTAAEFVNAPEDFVRATMSVVGLRLQKELKGIPCLEWTFEAKKKKNIGASRCFGSIVTDKKIIQQALSNYAATCALKLRSQQSAAGNLKVFIHTNPHRKQDEQYYQSIVVQMARATNGTSDIIKHALQGLDFIFRPGFNYLKCGIELGNIVPEDQIQFDLFTNRDDSKIKTATAALDKINAKFGKDLVRFSIQGFQKSYKARAEHLSKCFTTRLEDIIKIK